MGLLERYSDRWQPEPNTGCYIWTGNGSGIGSDRPRIRLKGSRLKKTVARLICEEIYGPPPTPEHIDAAHNTPNGCIGGACVNPDHIRWATPSQNMMDKPLEGCG